MPDHPRGIAALLLLLFLWCGLRPGRLAGGMLFLCYACRLAGGRFAGWFASRLSGVRPAMAPVLE